MQTSRRMMEPSALWGLHVNDGPVSTPKGGHRSERVCIQHVSNCFCLARRSRIRNHSSVVSYMRMSLFRYTYALTPPSKPNTNTASSEELTAHQVIVNVDNENEALTITGVSVQHTFLSDINPFFAVVRHSRYILIYIEE